MRALITLLLLVSSSSWGNKLLPLNEYLLQQNPSDPAVFEYVEYRCASSWWGVAKLLENQDPITSQQYQNDATTLMMRLIDKYMKNNNVDNATAFESVTTSIINISNIYIDEMNSNWQKTGSYFMNTYIEDDILLCKEVFS